MQNLKYLGLAGCALAIVGAFLVWATVSAGPFSVDVKGTDSGKDGTITLILAIVAAAAIFFIEKKPWIVWIALAAAVLVLLVGLYDTLDIMGTDDQGADVKVGIGLWITDLGGILATAAAAMIKLNAGKATPVMT